MFHRFQKNIQKINHFVYFKQNTIKSTKLPSFPFNQIFLSIPFHFLNLSKFADYFPFFHQRLSLENFVFLS